MLVLKDTDIADEKAINGGSCDPEGVSADLHRAHNRREVVRVSGTQTVTGDIDLGGVDYISDKGSLIHNVQESSIRADRQAAWKAAFEFSAGVVNGFTGPVSGCAAVFRFTNATILLVAVLPTQIRPSSPPEA
jgi:hypothetical protein